MGTRAIDIVAYIDATASFGLKLRIEKGENEIITAVSRVKHLKSRLGKKSGN